MTSAAYADLDCCDGTVGTTTDISTGMCCVAKSVGIMVGVKLAGLGLIVGMKVGRSVAKTVDERDGGDVTVGAVVGGDGEGVGIDVGESVDHQGFVGLSVRSWTVGRGVCGFFPRFSWCIDSCCFFMTKLDACTNCSLLISDSSNNL